MRLRPLRTVRGRVVDRQGKPVANVEVFQSGDGPEPTVDPDRRRRPVLLDGFRQGPVFLFARGDGFRFHGQLVREGEHRGHGRAHAQHRAPEPGDADAPRADPARGIAGHGPAADRAVVESGRREGGRSDQVCTLEPSPMPIPRGSWRSSNRRNSPSKVLDSGSTPRSPWRLPPRDLEEASAVAESIADPAGCAGALIEVIDALPATNARASSPCSIAPRSTPGRRSTRTSGSAGSAKRPSGCMSWAKSKRPGRSSPRDSRSLRG